MLQKILLVGMGGFLGANIRYFLSEWLTGKFSTVFGVAIPWGTAFVNITGSCLLAILTVWLARQFPVPEHMRLLAGTGFFGAYTTFSTFANESIVLWRQDWRVGAGYIILTNLLCLAGVLLGLGIANRLWQTPV